MKTNVVSFLMAVILSACSTVGHTGIPTNTPEPDIRKIPMFLDVSRYSEVLDSFGSSSLVAHFPKKIPPEATKVRFAYQPRIMQGAMFLELLMTLPESQIEELWIQYSGLPKYKFKGYKTIKDIPEPILYLIRDQNHQINRQFSIFFINTQPAAKDDFPWNHGTMYGVGLNKMDLEVVYWLQYW